MSTTYLLLLIVGITALLVRVLGRPARIFEYPYSMAAAFGIFIVPQAYSLICFPGGVSRQGVEDVLLMCNLCPGCAILG